MRTVEVLNIQKIPDSECAKIAAVDPRVPVDAGGWFDGEIRDSWPGFARRVPRAIGQRARQPRGARPGMRSARAILNAGIALGASALTREQAQSNLSRGHRIMA